MMDHNKGKFENNSLILTGVTIQKEICKQSSPVTLAFDLLTPKSEKSPSLCDE